MAYRSVDPTTGRLLEEHPTLAPGQIAAVLERAEAAFRSWRGSAFRERARVLRRAAELLRAEQAIHAETMALEMGKPVREGRAEIEKCAWGCEFYAEHGEAFLAPEPAPSDAARSYVRFDPLGPVLAIMPWNFPFWQVFRFAAPALMAGNVGILKHASNVPRCAKAIEDLLRRAGCPPGVFQAPLIASGEIPALIRHPALRAVTLTGSEKAGAEVGAAAGSVCKKTVLELGGSDPFIVLDDVDVAAVAAQAARARTVNSGQSCIAAKRFLVLEPVAKSFAEAFKRALESLVVGDPRDERTDVGPLARDDLRAELEAQVEATLGEGATLVTGGRRLEGPGFFFPPTLLADVRPGMTAAAQETFGPVAALLSVRTVEEAVEVANASPYGLGASIWCRDPERGEALAPLIEAGHVAVNGIVKSDPRLPFGGVKLSGHGRELARHGMLEFVNVKSVWVGAAS
jgi:succinate-semialdehyde dehydrogenase/glutarate-semialdehyde dehydrogenase